MKGELGEESPLRFLKPNPQGTGSVSFISDIWPAPVLGYSSWRTIFKAPCTFQTTDSIHCSLSSDGNLSRGAESGKNLVPGVRILPPSTETNRQQEYCLFEILFFLNFIFLTSWILCGCTNGSLGVNRFRVRLPLPRTVVRGQGVDMPFPSWTCYESHLSGSLPSQICYLLKCHHVRM